MDIDRKIDKGLLDYLNKNKNAVKTVLEISRDVKQDGREHIIITIPGISDPLFDFWQNPKIKKAKDPDNPKTMGGKKPYVMLMVDEVEKLFNSGFPIEYFGYAAKLAKTINWNTGIVKKKRSKKAFTFNDMIETWGVNERKGREIIKALNKYHLLSQDNEGYKISRQFIRKGGGKNDGAVQGEHINS
jgi:hypothetical protein